MLTVKRLCFLFAMAASTTLALPSKYGPRFETDTGTTSFLRQQLISGGNIYYPDDAMRAQLQGGGLFRMQLRPDGTVQSVTVQLSTGYTMLDEYVTRTLKDYRFRPGTKGALQWLVSFLQPHTIIVHLSLIKERNPPRNPGKQ
jgi:TonB family protein